MTYQLKSRGKNSDTSVVAQHFSVHVDRPPPLQYPPIKLTFPMQIYIDPAPILFCFFPRIHPRDSWPLHNPFLATIHSLLLRHSYIDSITKCPSQYRHVGNLKRVAPILALCLHLRDGPIGGEFAKWKSREGLRKKGQKTRLGDSIRGR